MKRLLALTIACAFAGGPVAVAAEPHPAASSAPAPTAHAVPSLAAEFPPDAVTQHSIEIDGKPVEYTARVGTITLRNDANQPTAKMSYVAYTVGDDPRRPVTFLYNGGPGSSTMWLLMGSVGPVHVVTPGDRLAGSPPYRWVQNHDSILDKTDLVFVDMPNTGFGRIMGAGKPKDFFGLRHDADAFAQFISNYITEFHRWNSPKFLFGESYGTPRSAELSWMLFNRGISLNGIVSQSSVLDFHLDWSQNYPYLSAAIGGGNLGYALYLPTMAATAWYHGMVPHRGTQESFIAGAAHFAMTSYLHALMQGDTLSPAATRSMAEQMHEYIGLPVQYLVRQRLMVPYARFLAGLLRDQAQTLGRYDARFTVTTLDPEETTPRGDASNDAMTAPYTTAVNTYLRETLKYDPALPYNGNTYALIAKDGLRSWKSAEGDINVVPELAQTMAANPQMLVFSANGYYDFATPWLATQYALEHLNLPPDLQKNVSFGFYQSGHMIYLNQSALDAYHQDLERWYDEALHS
ncbi:MAG TPA: peptidase S10 [Verrucomicrobiae bacterium]|nr:peptidase S10 [Verrucomicrobiae bacterium]